MVQILESKNMNPEQFAYWLQGFAEINQEAPTKEQWKIINDHLQLVFKKETPNYNFFETTRTPNDQIIC